MSDRQIPNGSAHWFVTRMLEMNVDRVRLFDGTDLSLDWPEKPSSTISQQQYLQIVDNALDETGDPALGLNIGRSQTLCELGFWGYAIISSPTLGDAEDISLQYWGVMGNLIEISRKEDKNYFEWSVYRPFPMKTTRQWRYAVEELLSTVYTGMCFMANCDVPPVDISLSYPEPEYGDLYRELFKCRIHFNEKADRIRFPISYLKIPTSTAHPQVAEVCLEQCRNLAAKLGTSDDLIDAVRKIITCVPNRLLQLNEVAKKMGLSRRTLQRRLKERQTTYQSILDQVRLELAKEYLLTTHLAIDYISERIGFSDVTTFRNAFKKWVGLSIGEYRKFL